MGAGADFYYYRARYYDLNLDLNWLAHHKLRLFPVAQNGCHNPWIAAPMEYRQYEQRPFLRSVGD